MHVNHFQIIDYKYDGNRPELVMFDVGDRRDSLPTLSGLFVTIRFYLDTYTGIAVTNCGVLHRSDLGMRRLQFIATDADLKLNEVYRTRTLFLEHPDRDQVRYITSYASDDCTLDRASISCDLSREDTDSQGDLYHHWPLADVGYVYF